MSQGVFILLFNTTSRRRDENHEFFYVWGRSIVPVWDPDFCWTFDNSSYALLLTTSILSITSWWIFSLEWNKGKEEWKDEGRRTVLCTYILLTSGSWLLKVHSVSMTSTQWQITSMFVKRLASGRNWPQYLYSSNFFFRSNVQLKRLLISPLYSSFIFCRRSNSMFADFFSISVTLARRAVISRRRSWDRSARWQFTSTSMLHLANATWSFSCLTSYFKKERCNY